MIKKFNAKRVSLDIELDETKEACHDVGSEVGVLEAAVATINDCAVQDSRQSTCNVSKEYEPYFAVTSVTNSDTGPVRLYLHCGQDQQLHHTILQLTMPEKLQRSRTYRQDTGRGRDLAYFLRVPTQSAVEVPR